MLPDEILRELRPATQDFARIMAYVHSGNIKVSQVHLVEIIEMLLLFREKTNSSAARVRYTLAHSDYTPLKFSKYRFWSAKNCNGNSWLRFFAKN